MQDEALATIQEGQAARLIRHSVEDELIAREEDIIRELVMAYRADTLTNEKLRGSIGEISGIRRFREGLESKIRQGVMTAESELGNGQDPS